MEIYPITAIAQMTDNVFLSHLKSACLNWIDILAEVFLEPKNVPGNITGSYQSMVASLKDRDSESLRHHFHTFQSQCLHYVLRELRSATPETFPKKLESLKSLDGYEFIWKRANELADRWSEEALKSRLDKEDGWSFDHLKKLVYSYSSTLKMLDELAREGLRYKNDDYLKELRVELPNIESFAWRNTLSGLEGRL